MQYYDKVTIRIGAIVYNNDTNYTDDGDAASGPMAVRSAPPRSAS